MRFLLLVPAFALALPAMAAANPEALLTQLPNPPGSPCRAMPEELRTFRERVNLVRKSVEEEMAKCRKEEKAAGKAMEGSMKAQALEASGMSSAPSGRMSREEKRAMAAKSMQEQTGMSMEDVEKLKGMSKEERRAWATSRSQSGSLGPRKPGAKARQIPGSGLSMAEMQEQQKLAQQAMARGAKLQTRYAQLEKEYAATERPEAPKRDFSSQEPPSDPICEDFSGRYRKILEDHFTAAGQTIKDLRRMEELTAKQYGMNAKPGAGLDGLKAVQEYADRLLAITTQFRR